MLTGLNFKEAGIEIRKDCGGRFMQAFATRLSISRKVHFK